MNDNKNDLRERTTEFALRIVTLYKSLPKTTEAQVLGKQVLRSGTSVGAQFRESQRAKSDPNFISINWKAFSRKPTKLPFGLNFWYELGSYPRKNLKRFGKKQMRSLPFW